MPTDRPVTVETPWLKIVTDADPDFEARKHKEVEYDFRTGSGRGRDFYADPYVRGAYQPSDFDYRDFDSSDFNTQNSQNGR